MKSTHPQKQYPNSLNHRGTQISPNYEPSSTPWKGHTGKDRPNPLKSVLQRTNTWMLSKKQNKNTGTYTHPTPTLKTSGDYRKWQPEQRAVSQPSPNHLPQSSSIPTSSTPSPRHERKPTPQPHHIFRHDNNNTRRDLNGPQLHIQPLHPRLRQYAI